MKRNPLMGNFVWGAHGRGAGIVVVEFPEVQRAVCFRAALYINDSGWTKVGPGEFLFACPDQFHRLACGLGQTRSFYRDLAGVLATIGGTGIGDDDVDSIFLKMKCFY